MLIRDVLQRDLNQKIEEIIQVDQINEESVYSELTEYVVTTRIRDQYLDLLRAIAEAPSNPDEGVGVWISGFFGSGKSSFAKNLGYVLKNPTVRGIPAAELFKQQVNDATVASVIDSINHRLPTEVVMFDVQKDRSQVGQGNLSISPYMYRVLLRELGYAEDFDIAELEITLEREDRLHEFIERFNARYATTDERNVWTRRGRTGTQVWNRTSVILHEMDPGTYPTADSFAHGLAQKRVDVTPRLLVERSFELMERRRPGQALVFILDEVGQYVAFSQERLEDLRAVVEQFGKESKNRIRARKAIAPVWVVVTAQERLDEVTDSLGDDKRVLLAKVQDRFKLRYDLSPADIREVATRRVLSKKPQGEQQLVKLFQTHEGQITAACKLERTNRSTTLSPDEFVQFYPYLPHYIELSIDIMSGIRLQPGATRHIGGSNRTIIGQVYQMLVHPRTAYADKQVGALVSLDKLYELVEGQVGSAKQKDINDISERFRSDPQVQHWTTRVAKAIALLEYVRDLPRSEVNIAAVLVDRVGDPAPLNEVKAALERLVSAQFVRNTDEGYKLQTAQEKDWTQKRRDQYNNIKQKNRNDIQREVLGAIFRDAKLVTYNYRTERAQRTFKVGLTVNGTPVITEKDVPLNLLIADDADELGAKIEEARTLSRDERNHYNDLYWVFALTPDVDDLVANVYASRQMITIYDQIRANSKINQDEANSLGNERAEEARHLSRLKEKMSEALANGTSMFRGTSKDASDLGRQPSEMFKRFFDLYVPDLYPKIDMGARNLKGSEAEDVLKAANLNALPQVFYGNDGGLDLVVQEGSKFVPNSNAPIAKEILDYLKRQNSFGEKVTGKILEEHFRGIGYGWERDMLRLVLAVLLRAGVIEVTHQGRRFRNHQDPQSRQPLVSDQAFRVAAFAPRESIGLQTLVEAVRAYEGLTGDEVDVEEGAIAQAFKKLAADEMQALLPVIASARANSLSVANELEEYRETLIGIQSAASDDCVRILVGEGSSLKATRDRVRDIRTATNDTNLALLSDARIAANEIAPMLAAQVSDATWASAVDTLREQLQSHDFFRSLPQIKVATHTIWSAYRERYLDAHQRRYDAYTSAIAEIQDRALASGLVAEGQKDAFDTLQPLLQPLLARQCVSQVAVQGEQPPELLPASATRCRLCGATLNQIESDIAAVSSLQQQALVHIQELAAPPERPVRHVRLARYFGAVLDSKEAVDTAVEQLQNELYELVAEGATIIVE